jgi:hypothetical protein
LVEGWEALEAWSGQASPHLVEMAVPERAESELAGMVALVQAERAAEM